MRDKTFGKRVYVLIQLILWHAEKRRVSLKLSSQCSSTVHRTFGGSIYVCQKGHKLYLLIRLNILWDNTIYAFKYPRPGCNLPLSALHQSSAVTFCQQTLDKVGCSCWCIHGLPRNCHSCFDLFLEDGPCNLTYTV